jgi:hypothetical protein
MERNRDIVRLLELLGQRHARGYRKHAAQDTVAENSAGAYVLAPAASATDAGGASHYFRHETIHVAGSRQIVSVAPMITDDEIPRQKMARDSDSRELLPDASVNRTEQLTF